jgi:hypothetical protein
MRADAVGLAGASVERRAVSQRGPFVAEAVGALWLFVIYAGIAFGAGLYEMRIIVPQRFPTSEGPRFRVDSDAMRRTDTGRKFWAYVTTVPLTALTLANLLFAWQAQGPRRAWWLAAAAITLVERVGTLLIHHERYATRAAAQASVFAYIEGFYDCERRRSALGYCAPAEYAAGIRGR